MVVPAAAAAGVGDDGTAGVVGARRDDDTVGDEGIEGVEDVDNAEDAGDVDIVMKYSAVFSTVPADMVSIVHADHTLPWHSTVSHQAR